MNSQYDNFQSAALSKWYTLNSWQFHAAVFALIFSLFPWEDLWISGKGMPFVDKDVYLRSFSTPDQTVLQFNSFDTFVSLITDEYLWHYGLNALLNSGLDINIAFFLITFITAFTFAGVILTRCSSIAVLLLVNPIFVDFACSQFRIALAASLLCAPFLIRNISIWLPLILCAVFIHTAAVILIALYITATTIGRASLNQTSFKCCAAVFVLVFLGLLVAVMLGPMRESILLSLEDRRALYDEDMSSSLTYNSFWILLLVAGFFGGPQWLLKSQNAFVCVVLSCVMFGTFFQAYTLRILATTFPLVITFMLNLPLQFRLPLVAAFVAYATLQWAYWLRP